MGDELKLVKYITEQVVTYIETPKEERKIKQKEPWSMKWFGMIPIGVTLWGKNTLTSSKKSIQKVLKDSQ
ncbi:YqzE family protein [Paenibacillus sp. CMAA1364]